MLDQRHLRISVLFLGFILTVALTVCAGPTKNPARSVSGPQVVVKPECVRLGVAKLVGTQIVFEGSGFKPKDSVFITLTGPNQTKIVVAEAAIQPDGTFKAEVSKLTKITEFLRADAGFEFEDKYKEFIIITQPPIPEGVYTAHVTSMMSDLSGETKLTVKGPSPVDSIKDLLGRLMGKIRYKKSK